MLNKLLTCGKVAKYLGVDLKTIHNWEDKGRFPKSIRTLGGQRRWRPEDVAAELVKLGMAVPEELSVDPDLPIEWAEHGAQIKDVDGDPLEVSWNALVTSTGVAVEIKPHGGMGSVLLDLAGIAALRRALDKAEAAHRARAT